MPDMRSGRALLWLGLFVLALALSPLLLLLSAEPARQKAGPEITGIDEWINTPAPIKIYEQRGKVVIVDFWTYSCINCLRTIPYLKEWDRKYRKSGLVVIGIHTPEFAFEKETDRVRAAVTSLHMEYPVGLDNSGKTWDAFANHYWPHKYFFGPDGTLRFEVVGEGRYEESEEKIRELLREGGADPETPPSLPQDIEKVDFRKIKTPEIFFGNFHGGFIGNPHGILSDPDQAYLYPDRFEENTFYLSGRFRIFEQYLVHADGSRGEIALNYEAKSVNWVAGSNRAGSWVDVKLDHRNLSPQEAGEDIVIGRDGKSRVFISEKRLYRIIRNQESGYGKHLLTLDLFEPDIESYSVTFG